MSAPIPTCTRPFVSADPTPAPSSSSPSHPPTPLYPTTTPALHLRIKIGIPQSIGSHSRGTALTVVPITSGTIVNHPDFGVRVNGVLKGVGNDYIHNDPTGKHMRLDAHAVIENDDGKLIYLHYTGVVDITPGLSAILGGSPAARSTDFGHSFIHASFESGHESFRDLENGIYVGAGRFVVEEKEPGLSVEYRISKVGIKTETDAQATVSGSASADQ